MLPLFVNSQYIDPRSCASRDGAEYCKLVLAMESCSERMTHCSFGRNYEYSMINCRPAYSVFLRVDFLY